MTIGLEDGLRTLLYQHLKASFPDAKLDECDVEGVALALLRRGTSLASDTEKLPEGLTLSALEPYRDALDALAESIGPTALAPEGNAPHARHAADNTGYYWVHATHTRKDPANYKPFEGKLAMVRVQLPYAAPRRFSTLIGTVEPSDHLLSTVREANDKYAQALGYPLEHLDLITPPRQLLRFGAISVLIGYRDDSRVPSCFILEAGTALGQPKVLYLGKNMDTKIDRISGYKPTAFSCSDNAYTGQLQMNGDEPELLHITARDILGGTTSAKPYMELSARFTRQTDEISSIWPGFLIARAALIVEARKARGLTNTCKDT